MRVLLWVLVIGLGLLPGSARADQPPRPTPIEVAAQVAVCMQTARYSDDGVQVEEVRGGVYSAELLHNGEPVETFHRRAYDPVKEPWVTRRDPIQPPIAMDPYPGFVVWPSETYDRNHATAQYALNCFNEVYPYPEH